MKSKAHRAKTKESKRLTLKDRLSRLSYVQAAKLLGPDGPRLIRQGAAYDEIDLDRDVYFRGDLFRLKLRGAGVGRKPPIVTITTMAAAGGEMFGAVFSFLGELVTQNQAQPPAEPLVAQVRDRLAECVEEDPSGRQRLTVTLPDRPRSTRLPKRWPGLCWPAACVNKDSRPLKRFFIFRPLKRFKRFLLVAPFVFHDNTEYGQRFAGHSSR